jgi:hypothetical protein
MFLLDELFQSRPVAVAGLDDQLHFVGLFHLALPTVNGPDARQYVHAGS